MDEVDFICKLSCRVVAGQFCLGLKRMFLRNPQKRGMPSFVLNLVSTEHGHKFVEWSEFVLELWEMWTWVLREGP